MAIPPDIPGLTDWRPLARGGFAIVWQARQESLNRLVAVKVDQRTLEVETEQRRFLREAGAAGRMSGHPGIVTVHDAGILSDDRPFLVMELCTGGSLTRWLKPDARPSQRRVRDVGVRIADALAAAHSRGVLHRDVKPANILIDAYDNAGLADFGLAALPDPGMELSQTLEALTPAYAPPEAFAQQPPTEFGDVYSLAATLYALLKGQPPRWPEGAKPGIETALEQLKQPIEPIPGVDPALMDLLLTALADKPTDRPTAAEFRDRLAGLKLAGSAAAVDGEGTAEQSATPASPTSPAEEPGANGRRHKRSRRLLALSVVAALVVVAVVVALMIASPNATVAKPPTTTPSGAVPSGGPASTASPTSSASTASPTPTPKIPAGFVDCSSELGAGSTYCIDHNECWGSLPSFADAPTVATAADCYENHLYQTYAAEHLPYNVLRKSQLDNDRRVRKLCTMKLANSMLQKQDRRSDWEVYALPPQAEKEDFFRCIFGRGERSTPFALHQPR